VSDQRFTAMSVNHPGNTQRWPTRETALRMLLARQPDVLCAQELRPTVDVVIDAELPHHRRVIGDERGWTHESNNWWNTRTFSLVGHGASPFGAIERDRRVFWTRLQRLPPSTIDWQFHRGSLRPLMTEVIDRPWRGVAPSDHRPLHTLHALLDGQNP
jgi:hypothetical protein